MKSSSSARPLFPWYEGIWTRFEFWSKKPASSPLLKLERLADWSWADPATEYCAGGTWPYRRESSLRNDMVLESTMQDDKAAMTGGRSQRRTDRDLRPVSLSRFVRFPLFRQVTDGQFGEVAKS